MNHAEFNCAIDPRDTLTVSGPVTERNDFWFEIVVENPQDKGIILSRATLRDLITFLEGCLQDAAGPQSED